MTIETNEALLSKDAESSAAALIQATETAEVLLCKAAVKAEELFARVKQLEGIIPICSYCKKIRDDQNSWKQLKQYHVI